MFNNFYNGKKILITGVTGFKGSWLALWLMDLGAEIIGFSLPPNSPEDNFSLCKLGKKINHHCGDIRNFNELNDFVRKEKPDLAFHLAAQALVLDSYEDPHNTFSTNLMGTVNFFEAIRSNSSVKVAINVTSDKCYKENKTQPFYSEGHPLGGKDPYSASKSCSEIITMSYLHSFFEELEVNIASVRAGNVIGAGDWSKNRIIPDYFKSLKSKSELVVRNASSTRPWQHVLEPLSGYLHLGHLLYDRNSKLQGGWNFGPNEKKSKSVFELIENLNKYCNNENVRFEDNDENKESKYLNLNTSKALEKLKWSSCLNFEETVKLTAKGYLSDLEKKISINNRMDLISSYCRIAQNKNISWA